MKKIVLLGFLALSVASSALAENDLGAIQNKIALQLQSEQWVKTTTALVNVYIDASVSDKAIENVQNAAMQKLNQLAGKGEWHILGYTRNQDRSGLESVRITAQSRLAQDALAGLRSKAKSISKPGETYTIASIDFTPSDDEIRQANASLRADIYAQAKAELDNINKLYTDQQYHIHTIDFTNRITPLRAQESMMMSARLESAPAAAPLSVGNKVYLQAMVELASIPDLKQ